MLWLHSTRWLRKTAGWVPVSEVFGHTNKSKVLEHTFTSGLGCLGLCRLLDFFRTQLPHQPVPLAMYKLALWPAPCQTQCTAVLLQVLPPAA